MTQALTQVAQELLTQGRRDSDCSELRQVRSRQIIKLDHSHSGEEEEGGKKKKISFREGLPRDRGQNDLPKKEINLKLWQRSESWKANNINLKHEHMSSGCFLAPPSPLTASFYQVPRFVQSLGRTEVNQSFSNGAFKTRLIPALSLPHRGRANLSAPLRDPGRLTPLSSGHSRPL